MRVLLDEDVPHLLWHELPGHDVSTVMYVGWSGAKNDVLSGLAGAADFDVFVTCDRTIQHQQAFPEPGLAVIVLEVRDARMRTILPLVPDIRAASEGISQPGTLSIVGSWRV